MDFLGKKYKLLKDENIPEFFKAMGFPVTSTATKDSSAPTTELTKNADGTFTLTVGSPAGYMVRTFAPGQEIDDDMFGQTFKSTFTVEANKLHQVQKAPNGKVITIVRDFSPSALVVTNTVSGWDGKSVRHYEIV